MNEEQLEKFPEAIREWDEAKNAETPEAFWDQVTNMRSKFGTALFKPGSDAGAEDWGKFSDKAIALSDGKLMPRPDLEDVEQRNALYKSLGRPEDVNGYDFAEIEGAPAIEDARKKFISEIAFEAGLTKSQLKLLDQKIREADFLSATEIQNTVNSEMKDLKQEWGLVYEDRVHSAKKIASTFFPHLGDDASLSAHELKAFHSLAKQLLGQQSEFKDQGDQHSDGLSPTEAADKIAEIRNNKEHPYHDRTKAGHEVAKKRMRELYLAKNGEAA